MNASLRVTDRDGCDPRNEAHAVRLVLPYPISSNAYWSHRVVTPKGRRAMALTHVTHEAKAYQRDVQMLAKQAGIRSPIAGRVALIVRLFPARPQDWARRAAKDPDGWDDSVRSIDLDNALKVLLDALKDVAFNDDSWVRRIDAERCEPDERGARVEVEIAPMAVERVAPGLFA